MTSTPTPHDASSFATYLHRLAAETGHYLDLEFLTPAAAHEPVNVVTWINAAAKHAGATYADTVLRDVVAFLQSLIADADPDHVDIEATLLAEAVYQRRRIRERITAARETFRRISRILDADVVGLHTLPEPDSNSCQPTAAAPQPTDPT
jgi:hypothetical protein